MEELAVEDTPEDNATFAGLDSPMVTVLDLTLSTLASNDGNSDLGGAMFDFSEDVSADFVAVSFQLAILAFTALLSFKGDKTLTLRLSNLTLAADPAVDVLVPVVVDAVLVVPT